jgi:hypothetical protein
MAGAMQMADGAFNAILCIAIQVVDTVLIFVLRPFSDPTVTWNEGQ